VTRTDCWATWLADLRTAGDPESRRSGFERVARWRDRILDNAELHVGETLLDVGCGEGLVGLGALERGAGSVVFADISRDVLDVCREVARERGVLDRSRFVECSAEYLEPIERGSVDVVTTRSVLIYVEDKSSAFSEFFRVLRPSGRISLFEPINRFARTDDDAWLGYDMRPIGEISAKLRAVYEAIQPPEFDPMLNFDERDLLELAGKAGFFPIHLQLEAAIDRNEIRDWDLFVSIAPNPRIPPLAAAMERVLDAHERMRFEAYLRPLVESGSGVSRSSLAYVMGVKPGSRVVRPT
jgi:arsenite methyltransferase